MPDVFARWLVFYRLGESRHSKVRFIKASVIGFLISASLIHGMQVIVALD